MWKELIKNAKKIKSLTNEPETIQAMDNQIKLLEKKKSSKK